jgi:hypothetical protein
MPKNLLPYKYIEETKSSGLTGLASLPMYLDLMCRLGVVQASRTHLDGNIHPFCVWKPSNIASALLMLNLSGGDNVDDLRKIQADSGFRPLFAQYLNFGLTPSERSTQQKIMEAQGAGSVPSPDWRGGDSSLIFHGPFRDALPGAQVIKRPLQYPHNGVPVGALPRKLQEVQIHLAAPQ